MAAGIAFGELVDATKLRWRIERDYRELKQETIPPSGPAFAGRLKKPAVSIGYKPRGAANPARTPCGELNCQPA